METFIVSGEISASWIDDYKDRRFSHDPDVSSSFYMYG
jgi:hypothetical protein